MTHKVLDELDMFILKELNCQPQATQAEIAAKQNRAVSVINSRLDMLEEDGYIERPKERKARMIKLTYLGKQALSQAGLKPRA